jgi:hypothetical protein
LAGHKQRKGQLPGNGTKHAMAVNTHRFHPARRGQLQPHRPLRWGSAKSSDEYTFRFNRRKSHSRGKLFYRLAQHALMADPCPRATLKAPDSPSMEDEFDGLTDHNMLG